MADAPLGELGYDLGTYTYGSRTASSINSPQGSIASSGKLILSKSSPDIRAGFSKGFSGSLSDEQPSVFSLRQARQRADADAQTLANRIALLRSEGEKALKRLDDTRYRTLELQHRPLKAEEDEAFLKRKLEDIQTKMAKNRQRKDEGRFQREQKQREMFEQKRNTARAIRDHTKSLLETRRQNDELKLKQNTQRAVEIRSRCTGAEKQRLMEESRMSLFHKSREERAAQGSREVMMMQSTEKRINELEEEEVYLLRWLQAKQLEQKAAYDELEKVADERRARSMRTSRTGT
mmetsp:Transcript_46777/g.100149  ORF Transcript_46777/g.100149 Transcript_46777/m.100149 type:complete len:292 (+) Transcript_46777:57-932(+)